MNRVALASRVDLFSPTVEQAKEAINETDNGEYKQGQDDGGSYDTCESSNNPASCSLHRDDASNRDRKHNGYQINTEEPPTPPLLVELRGLQHVRVSETADNTATNTESI
jgi:hypothetical protein